MEVTSQSCESEGGADKSADCQPQCISSQPAANGMLPHHQAPPPISEPVIDSSSINGVLYAPPAASAVSCEAPPSAPMGPPLPPCEQLDSNQKTLSSSRSHASSKTNTNSNGDECCAECLLACLYCELPSLCVELWACLACDGGCEAVAACCTCCCSQAAGEAACAEEACQAALDCGIMEDCCSSADCLEICLECCSLCSPAS